MEDRGKLELTWIDKNKRIKLEPRILVENKGKSYGDIASENTIIHGDNLLALKSLEQEYTGRIKCIYIDPPYNTGNAFEHYNDGIEHSIWLSLMRDRLELLYKLLSNDGSLWVSIDDDECHYLKVLCDEVFIRKNFVANIIWEKKYSPQNDAKWLSDSHDHILIYAKNKDIWRPNLLPRTEEMDSRYKNPDNDPRGVWKAADLSVKTPNPRDIYPITTPSGRVANPPASRSWVVSKEKFDELVADNRIWFGKDGNNVPSVKKFLNEVKDGTVAKTIWFRNEVGDNQEAKKEVKLANSNDVFTTPKPERLIKRILELATNEGDIVLDSFAGSGTTGAVAHKMKRQWIMVEIGEHCNTHIVPRMIKVVDGLDKGGITESVEWNRGGGFKFYKLVPSLLRLDKLNNWVIDKSYNPDMLAAAMAKLEGFKYSPDQNVYWKQGQSTEMDYIFTTTTFITVEYLDKIHEDMQHDESLLICCRAFQEACTDRYSNITMKKIPGMILGRCEFGKNDYSLNVAGASQSTINNSDPDDGEVEIE